MERSALPLGLSKKSYDLFLRSLDKLEMTGGLTVVFLGMGVLPGTCPLAGGLAGERPGAAGDAGGDCFYKGDDVVQLHPKGFFEIKTQHL